MDKPKLKKNDSGNFYIKLNCSCGEKRCKGHVHIQPDRLTKKRMFYVGVTGSWGDEQIIFLTRTQMETLACAIRGLLEMTDD